MIKKLPLLSENHSCMFYIVWQPKSFQIRVNSFVPTLGTNNEIYTKLLGDGFRFSALLIRVLVMLHTEETKRDGVGKTKSS